MLPLCIQRGMQQQLPQKEKSHSSKKWHPTLQKPPRVPRKRSQTLQRDKERGRPKFFLRRSHSEALPSPQKTTPTTPKTRQNTQPKHPPQNQQNKSTNKRQQKDTLHKEKFKRRKKELHATSTTPAILKMDASIPENFIQTKTTGKSGDKKTAPTQTIDDRPRPFQKGTSPQQHNQTKDRLTRSCQSQRSKSYATTTAPLQPHSSSV